MISTRQAEALSWLGIDTWQLRSGGEPTPAVKEQTSPVPEAPPSAPAERTAVESSTVETPTAAATTVAATVRIQAPAEGPLRRLAERIARVARVPAASIGLVPERGASVMIADRSWSIGELLASPDQKRALWRCLCRR